MGTLFCVGLQRLEECSDNTASDDANKDSVEYMSCHSDSRYALRRGIQNRVFNWLIIFIFHSHNHSSGDEGSESSHSADELDIGAILNVASVSL